MKPGDIVYHVTGYCVHELVLGEEVTPLEGDEDATHCWLIQDKKCVAEFAKCKGLDLHTASLCFPRDRIANKSDIYPTKRAALEALIEYSDQNARDARSSLFRLDEEEGEGEGA